MRQRNVSDPALRIRPFIIDPQRHVLTGFTLYPTCTPAGFALYPTCMVISFGTAKIRHNSRKLLAHSPTIKYIEIKVFIVI